MNDFPIPGTAPSVVAVPAPGAGPGYWAGSSSAALDDDGHVVLAYRVRAGFGGDVATVVARSEDGERFTTVATLDKDRFDAMSMERPALVHTGEARWRLYACCATKNSKHWWIDVLEADEPAGFEDAAPRTVFPGDAHTGVKDPIVQRRADGWHAWICCHPLDEADEEDRMTTSYATSADGLSWNWRGAVLRPRPGTWDARGARLTAVVLPLGDGSHRIYYEAPLADGSHELRTELIRA